MIRCHQQSLMQRSFLTATLLLLTLMAVLGRANLQAGEDDGHEQPDDAQLVADRLDAQMRLDWQRANAIPAPDSEDSEFLRRVFLHLNGTLPDVMTARTFLADDSPQKRRRVIEQCLDGPAYCANFAQIFRDVLLPDPGTDYLSLASAGRFQIWLTQQFAQETPYDQIVREIVSGANREQAANDSNNGGSKVTPAAFHQLREAKPENIAAATTRLFLGIRIECAQCHDHPFDHWTQEQFWSVAAFFSGQSAKTETGDITFKIKIPNTEKIASAAFLENSPPGWKTGSDSRLILAEWVASPDNRRFAEATVNRMWGHFFGRGLVDPVDDFSDQNLASHPEVLTLLADEFVKHQFDIKFLIRVITCSKVYQLSSRRTDPSQEPPETFARMRAQGLTATQILNSIHQASAIEDRNQNRFAVDGEEFVMISDQEFTGLFPRNDGSSLERESSILQALLMMNGQLTSQSVTPNAPGTLLATLDAPFFDTRQKIDTLFLATLTRFPTPQERERIDVYLAQSGQSPGKQIIDAILNKGKKNDDEKLAQLFWAILNSSEFCLNH